MKNLPAHHYLVKFFIGSSFFFFIGTVHGVVQVIPPVRAWLDSIGSPYGGPGHMIDPLAHAHINIIGGVVLLMMGITYYLLPKLMERPIYSKRLVNHTFWWITLGTTGFYSTLMFFGIWQGMLWLDQPEKVAEIDAVYSKAIAIASTIMGVGFWIYFTNLFMTAKHYYTSK